MRHYSLYLVGVCVFVFALQNIFPAITENFSLVSDRALVEPWMFLTNIFMHADIMHLLYNMFALALFGSMLEKIVGSKRFLAIFFVAGLLASAAAFFFYSASLGASGAIFGILGALAVLRPKMVIWIYVPMPMFVAIFVWAAIDLTGFFYPSGIANAAHLAGLVAGLVFGFALRKRFEERMMRKNEPKAISDKEFRKWEDEWVK